MNDPELINKGSTLITFKHGERKCTHTFITIEQLPAEFLIGFDFVDFYIVELYWEGEEFPDLVNSQVRFMSYIHTTMLYAI